MANRNHARRRKPSCRTFHAAAADVLESRQMLSGSSLVDDGTVQESTQQDSVVDSELQTWRDDIRQKLIAEADAQYGDLYGTQTERYTYFIDEIGIDFGRAIALNSVAAADSLSFSETNVQVAGVDEGDIVETDGEYLYILSGQELVIVKAINDTTVTPEVVSRTQLPYQPQAMFLHDGRLTMIGQDYGEIYYGRRAAFTAAIDFAPSPSRTTVSVYDVSDRDVFDRSLPELTQETVVDGDFVTARAIGEQVFVVISNNSGVPYLPSLQIVSDDANDSATIRILRSYRYQTRDEFLLTLNNAVDKATPPSTYRRTMDGGLERLGWLDDSVFDTQVSSSNGSLTTVLKFNTSESDPGPVDNVSVPVGNGWSSSIYASENAIYLLTNEYEQIESDGTFFRINQGEVFTRINKVSIDGEFMQLTASGTVRGSVDNQFSVDEHNGYLRVATTTGAVWSQSSENHLFVLQQVGALLTVVGSVEGLAPTETIYSMRFAGDRAWMVTFRKVDPVFSFDLSDPTNPRVTGELKIPGYSDYLQLIDDNHLLAIGRGTIDSGSPRFAWFQEVQVSLFDISDPQNPTLLHRFSFEGGRSGQSEALIDHHAFNYIPDRQILAVPFHSPDNQSWEAGLITLHIDPENGITLLGDVDQPGSVRRSVRIEDLLYAIAEQSVSVVSLNDPGTIIDTVELIEETKPVRMHVDLLERYLARTNNVFVNRFRDVLLRLDFLYIGLGERPNDLIDALEAEIGSRHEYEFRISNPETGEVIREVTSDRSIIELTRLFREWGESGDTVFDGLTHLQIQSRSRDTAQQHGRWSAWSELRNVTVGSNRPVRTSPEILPAHAAILKWSKVADDGRGNFEISTASDPPQVAAASYKGNPVDSYQVWVIDAKTRQRVLWNQAVNGTELDLSSLHPGRFWVWIRSVFADGTTGEWSEGSAIQRLGPKLKLLSAFAETTNTSPMIEWEGLADATSFEVEITSPDGSERVYSSTQLTGSRLELPQELPGGRYSFRVRAQFANGGFTEWSDSFDFSVVDRPRIDIGNDSVAWKRVGNEVFEVWASNKATGLKILHVKDWTQDNISNLKERLGVNHGQVDLWVRAILPDGSKTKWSQKAVVNLFAEAMELNPVSGFGLGERQQISWQPAAGIETVEVYLQKIGEPGAAYRMAGITGVSHTIADVLASGDYRLWLRGALAGGGFTRWGAAHSLTVADRAAVSVADGIVHWTTTADTVRSEIWINEVNERGRLVTSRVAHAVDLATDHFDLDNLPGGRRYSIWVRTFRQLGSEIVNDGWSKRINVERPAPASLIDVFAKATGTLLKALDSI